MDPEADAVMKLMIESNQLNTVNRVLFSLKTNAYDPSPLPPLLRDYLDKTSQLPSWTDWNKMKIAQDLYALYGLEISMILFFKSLPESYCCPKGVKVLHSTGRLNQDPTFKKFTRRIVETSQFVMNVLSHDSFLPEGSAIITIQKIRVIHASIRYYLLSKHGWDSETYGEPINQEDMAGTLMSFSALVIEGLELLNIHWTDAEKDAFIHTWNVTGYILGVDPSVLPKDYKEATQMGYQIFDDQKGYSMEGQELTQALIEFIHYILPGNMFDGVAETLIAYFIGSDKIGYLGLKQEEGFFEKKLPVILRFVSGYTGEIKDHSAIIQSLVKPFARLILNGILLSYNDHKGPAIMIPPSLQANWKLGTDWETKPLGPEILGLRLAIQKKINKFE